MLNVKISALFPHSATRILSQWFERFFLGKSTTHAKDLKILTSRVPQRNSPARPDFNKAYNQPHPYLCVCLVIQSCPTLCNPMDCSPPGSSVHGVLQERTLEWVAMPSSRVFSQPRDRTQISCTAGGFFTV